MSSSHARRRVIFGGAAILASAAASLISVKARANLPTSEITGPVVVRWNSGNDSWAPRPADAPFGVVFLSTNDAEAAAPHDRNARAGDVWRRHPDALAA